MWLEQLGTYEKSIYIYIYIYIYMNICHWRHAFQTPPKVLYITVPVCHHRSKVCKQMNYRTVKMIPIIIISTILVFLLIEISLRQNEMQITAENMYSPGILRLHPLNLRALLTHFQLSDLLLVRNTEKSWSVIVDEVHTLRRRSERRGYCLE